MIFQNFKLRHPPQQLFSTIPISISGLKRGEAEERLAERSTCQAISAIATSPAIITTPLNLLYTDLVTTPIKTVLRKQPVQLNQIDPGRVSTLVQGISILKDPHLLSPIMAVKRVYLDSPSVDNLRDLCVPVSCTSVSNFLEEDLSLHYLNDASFNIFNFAESSFS